MFKHILQLLFECYRNTSMTDIVDLGTWPGGCRPSSLTLQSRPGDPPPVPFVKTVQREEGNIYCLTSNCLERIAVKQCPFWVIQRMNQFLKEKMRATFQYRQSLIKDKDRSSTVLDVFPRFLDIPGLVSVFFFFFFQCKQFFKVPVYILNCMS